MRVRASNLCRLLPIRLCYRPRCWELGVVGAASLSLSSHGCVFSDLCYVCLLSSWEECRSVSKTEYVILSTVLLIRESRKVSGAHGKAVHYSHPFSCRRRLLWQKETSVQLVQEPQLNCDDTRRLLIRVLDSICSSFLLAPWFWSVLSSVDWSKDSSPQYW